MDIFAALIITAVVIISAIFIVKRFRKGSGRSCCR